MSEQIPLPDLGEGIESAEVISVLVGKGDRITKGQAILIVESEKSSIEVPAPAAGIIDELLVQKGDKIAPGQGLLTYQPDSSRGEPGSESSDTKVSAPTEPVQAPTRAALGTAETYRDIPASPLVRRRAREMGIDLHSISGSGLGGRITVGDIESHQSRGPEAVPEATAPRPTADQTEFGPEETEPLTPTRRAIAAKMAETWTRTPHVVHIDYADLTRIEKLRAAYKPYFVERQSHISQMLFILKALVVVLKRYPRFNASYVPDREELVRKKYINMGIAVDTPKGLLVPVLPNLEKMDMLTMGKELLRIASDAREGRIDSRLAASHSFTVTNLGAIGGSMFTPIINSPDTAILGLMRIQSESYLSRKKKVKFRKRIPLCLSYDHRIIDGADAARFVNDLIELIEQPDRLLFHI